VFDIIFPIRIEIIIFLFLYIVILCIGNVIDFFYLRKLKKALKREKWIYEEGKKLKERQEQRRINNEYMHQINGDKYKW